MTLVASRIAATDEAEGRVSEAVPQARPIYLEPDIDPAQSGADD